MSFTDQHENAILDANLGSGATLLASTLEIGLSTTTPTDSGGNITEPVGGSYARITISNNNTTWNAASSGTKTNAIDLVFPEATGNWGTISHWIIYSGGAAKITGVIDNGAGTPTPITVVTSNRMRFSAGTLRVSLD